MRDGRTAGAGECGRRTAVSPDARSRAGCRAPPLARDDSLGPGASRGPGRDRRADCRDEAGCTRQGHVPGARFLWAQAYAPSTPDGSYDLPAAEQATAIFRELGLGQEARIVLVYSGAQIQQTARALLTFEHFGFERRVSIMNGGFDAWKAEGRAVSVETPTVAPGTAVAKPGGRFVVDASYVRARVEAPAATIVDAREARFYQGDGGGQPRPGHIPGAVNLPFSKLVDGTTIKDDALLRETFTAAGVKPGTEVVSYCHIGQQASLVWLAARILGYEARLYDGSFEDWSGREDLPVLNPAVAKAHP